ncbi:B12-binding domain-containing radical SAM protein [Spirosoma gilvum]
MKKILFTNAYFYRFDKKQWEAQKPYPPYGTILAAAIIREAGFEVDVFDANFIKSPEEISHKLSTYKPDYLVILDDNFNYLSKMCLSVMREACLDFIRLGKAAGCKVLVNSADATDHYDKYLQAGADVVLLGEPEQTLLDLLKMELTNLECVQGVAFKKGEQTIVVPRLHTLPALDTYPMPAWDLVNLKDYKTIWEGAHGYFSLNIATTRGCPFKCNWCAKPIYGNRYNSRSPQKVVDEINLLMSKGAVHFWICDDIFGLKPGWVNEFKEALTRKKLKPKLKIQSRADLLLKEDSIQELVDAGLNEVWIGAESGSQKILDAMDKGITLTEIEASTRLLKNKGVKVAFFLQYGYLGEEWEDIQQTLAMVKRLLPDDLGISVSYPLPGTGFYNKVKTQLQEKQNWEDSDDLAVMYEAKYPAHFYRLLHQYTHWVHRKERLIKNWKKTPATLFVKLPYLWLREQFCIFKMKPLLLPKS